MTLSGLSDAQNEEMLAENTKQIPQFIHIPSIDGIARRITPEGFSRPVEETVELIDARQAILDALDRVEPIDRDVLRSLVSAVVAKKPWDTDIPSTWAELPHNHPSIAEAVAALSSDWNVTVNALVRGRDANVNLSFRLQRKNTGDEPIRLSVRLPVAAPETVREAA